MSYGVIHRLSGNMPWRYTDDDEQGAIDKAKELSEDGDEWAVMWFGPNPNDNRLVATFPDEPDAG